MLSKTISLILNILFILNIYGQKYDNTWILGSSFPSGRNDSCFYGMEINFDNKFSIKRKILNQRMDSHNNSICDKDGNLLLYTNGCHIKDAQNNIIENGDSLNPNFDYEWFCTSTNEPKGIPYPNASLFLPLENDIIAYLSLETKSNPLSEPHVYSPNILKTIIDYKSGRPQILSKNLPILANNYFLNRFGLVAFKHQDNQSWWIISRNLIDSSFHIMLINQDTVISKIQRIGMHYKSGDISQSTFSPDGNIYATYSITNGAEILNFDRAKGILSNYKKISITDTASGYCGVAISPNSRFLYISTMYDLFQFDLKSTDIEASIEHIQHYNNTFSQCSDNGVKWKMLYYQMQLGPDCRIYMTSISAAFYLNVILFPDRKGKDCQFLEAGIKLPSFNYSSIPQFPNYRINQSYPCDSTIILPSSNSELGNNYNVINVVPNPATDQIHLNIELHNQSQIFFTIHDIHGQQIFKEAIPSHQLKHSFDIHELPPGIFIYAIQSKEGVIRNGKIVKL